MTSAALYCAVGDRYVGLLRLGAGLREKALLFGSRLTKRCDGWMAGPTVRQELTGAMARLCNLIMGDEALGAEAQIDSGLPTKHQNDEHDDNNQAERTAADPDERSQKRGDEMIHSDVLSRNLVNGLVD